MTLSSVFLLLQSASQRPVVSPALYCPTMAGNAIGLANLATGHSDRLRLSLILSAIRLCPGEFVEDVSVFPDSAQPLKLLADRRDQQTTELAGYAVTELLRLARSDDRAFARLRALLGPPKPRSASVLKPVAKSISEGLAELASKETSRAGDSQVVLVEGTLMMWLIDREALNAAFRTNAAVREWLKPYSPSIVEVGPIVGSEANDAFAASVRGIAEQNDGPVDLWFRKFRIER